MKINAIETFRTQVQPNIMFVQLRTEDGLTGLGEAFFGPKAVEAYIHETVAPVLLAMPDANPEFAAKSLAPYLGYQGAGAETRGNAAIDLALWDLLAKTAGLPLTRLLGGPTRESIPVYNTCAGPNYVRTTTRQSSDNWGVEETGLDRADYEDLQAFMSQPKQLAQELRDEGFRGMKVWPFDRAAERTNGMEISRKELRDGLHILGEIREAVGSDLDLMIELHGLWNRPAAEHILSSLEQFDPFWVEDPLRADATDALIALATDVNVRIALGETAVGRRGVLPLLQAGVVDILTLDLQWTGGLTEARKVAAMADAFAVSIAPHDCTGPATLAACVHLACSSPNSLVQEVVRAFIHTWYRDLVSGLPEIQNGTICVSEAPGHGVELLPSFIHSPSTTVQESKGAA